MIYYSIVLLSHKDLKPDVSIVDPYFLKTVPKKIFAASGFDAFSQAIESYWSRGSTSRSRMYSRKAINLIEKNLLDACLKKSNSSSLKMSIASNLAGRAISQLADAIAICVSSSGVITLYSKGKDRYRVRLS